MTRPADKYEYEKLDGNALFRVAEILPGIEADPIFLHLRPTSRGEPPAYEAVSYAWGDQRVQRTIYCGGKRLGITQNLHVALTHLRLKNQSRLLWADALW